MRAGWLQPGKMFYINTGKAAAHAHMGTTTAIDILLHFLQTHPLQYAQKNTNTLTHHYSAKEQTPVLQQPVNLCLTLTSLSTMVTNNAI